VEWTRSDAIAAGSLGVALLALLYSPIAQVWSVANAPSVYMKVDPVLITVTVSKEPDVPTATPSLETSRVKTSTVETRPPPREPGPPNAPEPAAPPPERPVEVEPTSMGPDSPGRGSRTTWTTFDSVNISGAAANLPGDGDLWIVLRPSDDGKFYPVGLHRNLKEGNWSISENPVHLPRPGSYGVFAYYAPSRPSAALAEWDLRQDKKPPGEYDGMPSLPPELMLMASESIVRPNQ